LIGGAVEIVVTYRDGDKKEFLKALSWREDENYLYIQVKDGVEKIDFETIHSINRDGVLETMRRDRTSKIVKREKSGRRKRK
jgi:hypothetical protein